MPRHDHLPRPSVSVKIKTILRLVKRGRKPPEAGIAIPAVPPKGPLPKQGGAEAPLEFDD